MEKEITFESLDKSMKCAFCGALSMLNTAPRTSVTSRGLVRGDYHVYVCIKNQDHRFTTDESDTISLRNFKPVENPVKYAIYQFFIDTMHVEHRYLVGFVEAVSEDDARDVYVRKIAGTYSTQQFIRGYLSAHTCRDADFNRQDLLESIEQNKKTMGVWAYGINNP